MENKGILYEIFWEELNKRIGNTMYTVPQPIVDKVAIYLNHCKVTHENLDNGRFVIHIEKNGENLNVEIVPQNKDNRYYIVSDIIIN